MLEAAAEQEEAATNERAQKSAQVVSVESFRRAQTPRESGLIFSAIIQMLLLSANAGNAPGRVI